MYEVINNLLPAVFNDMFTMNVDIHNYPTRQKVALHVPVSRHIATRKQPGLRE